MKINSDYISRLANEAAGRGYASRLAVRNAVAAGVVRIEGHGLWYDLEQVRRKADRIQDRISLRLEWLAEHPAAVGFSANWREGLRRRDPLVLEQAWSHAEAQVVRYERTGWIGKGPGWRR
jgi:hypothetical protein